MKKLVLCGLILLFPLYGLAAPPPAKVGPVSVTVQLEKTAVWVGDEFRYTLSALRDPDVELVLDNFKKDYLPLAPFVVQDLRIREGAWRGSKKKTEITLVLKTFETGKSELTIPPLQLYYFVHKPGMTKKESSVSTLLVPAVRIGLRSTLVSERLSPRETQPAASPPLALILVLFAAGLAGCLWLAGGALRWGWKKFNPDEAMRQLTRKERKRIAEHSLARLRAGVQAAGDDPRKWSGAIAGALRDFIEQMLQTPAVGLTPEEIETTLAQTGVDGSLRAEVKAVLAQLDELRYGKNPEGGRGLRAQLLTAAEVVIASPKLVSL